MQPTVSTGGQGVSLTRPEGDFHIRAAMGEFSNISPIFKFGRASIGTTEAVIWDDAGTGAYYDYHFATSAEKISVVSDSALDTGAGAGAQTMIVYGHDANNDEISEEITLAGVTPVVTAQDFLRIYRAVVIVSGTDSVTVDANQGTVTISGVTSLDTYAKILPNNGQTLQSNYTVPAGRQLLITGLSASVGQGKEVLIKGRIRSGTSTGHAFVNKYALDLYESPFTASLSVPIVVPEKTDICFTAITAVGTVDVSISYSGLLIDI